MNDLLDNFVEWHQKILPEVTHVSDLLSQRLPDDPSELISVLCEIESWNARVGVWLTQCENYLKKFRLFYLSEKGERSEKERLVKLESDTSDYEMVKEQIEVLASCIKQRLIWGESRLAWERQFNIRPIQGGLG